MKQLMVGVRFAHVEDFLEIGRTSTIQRLAFKAIVSRVGGWIQLGNQLIKARAILAGDNVSLSQIRRDIERMERQKKEGAH